MKITYDEHNRVSEIIFAEGEDQKAFWEFMQNCDKEITAREHELTERNKNYNEACKEMCIAREKEITERNKDFVSNMKLQQSYSPFSGFIQP